MPKYQDSLWFKQKCKKYLQIWFISYLFEALLILKMFFFQLVLRLFPGRLSLSHSSLVDFFGGPCQGFFSISSSQGTLVCSDGLLIFLHVSSVFFCFPIDHFLRPLSFLLFFRFFHAFSLYPLLLCPFSSHWSLLYTALQC